jgi:glutaredoxin-related protein
MKKIIIILFLLIPFLTLAQESPAKKKAYFFYGDNCPHCKNVEAYFQENGIYDKYDITSLEFSNPFNTRLLLKFGEAYNDPNKGGVPAIAFGDKFIVGDQPIMDNFVKDIDAASNANELPDADKIASTNNSASTSDNLNQDNQAAPATSGNKKSYFSVAIIVLIALGAGALIYVNRKKS